MKVYDTETGKTEECKFVENLGFQAGYQVKEVEHGKEDGFPRFRKIVKRNGRWEFWTMKNRMGGG
jgi:hypothetical protein